MEHTPVMMKQAIDGLGVRPDGVYWDGTFGRGGHSARILELLDARGALFASDRDDAALTAAQAPPFAGDSRFRFFKNTLEDAVHRVPDGLAGFLWDLGCSTPQLRDAERGFSFKEAGPLDMRMDRDQETTAADLVNDLDETELANLIYRYGEERLSRRIAARVAVRRREARIEDTATLADICRAAYPRRRHRIDPATRTFQALRIAVNDELGQVERTLPTALAKLSAGGRGVVISFHSLEDRIVKHCFRNHAQAGGFRVLTKKPLIPDEAEAAANPAARSAKLRVLQKEEGQ